MWGTGRRAGEANVTEGLGVDPPPPPTRGGWLKYPEPDVLTPRLPDSDCPAHTLPRTHLLALGRGCLSRGTLPVKTRAEVRTVDR